MKYRDYWGKGSMTCRNDKGKRPHEISRSLGKGPINTETIRERIHE